MTIMQTDNDKNRSNK